MREPSAGKFSCSGTKIPFIFDSRPFSISVPSVMYSFVRSVPVMMALIIFHHLWLFHVPKFITAFLCLFCCTRNPPIFRGFRLESLYKIYIYISNWKQAHCLHTQPEGPGNFYRPLNWLPVRTIVHRFFCRLFRPLSWSASSPASKTVLIFFFLSHGLHTPGRRPLP